MKLEFVLNKDVIVAFCAVLSLIISIINSIFIYKNGRIKIVVIPKTVISEVKNTQTGGKIHVLTDREFINKNELFAFEIINKSTFTVYINELGFKTKGYKNAITLTMPLFGDNGDWPRELKSRDSFVAYGKLEGILKNAKENRIKCAFVGTACNNIFYGNSKALKKLLQYASDLTNV